MESDLSKCPKCGSENIDWWHLGGETLEIECRDCGAQLCCNSNERIINFKHWLSQNGVDTKLFWKNCKLKHQGWYWGESYTPRKELRYFSRLNWVCNAFSPVESLQSNINWFALSKKWQLVCSKYKVEFGFGGEK